MRTAPVSIRLLLLVPLLVGSAAARADDKPDRLTRLIDRIAAGDEVESADATERLLDEVVGPLAEALGSLESRPLLERVRLWQALRRVTAELRVRLFRADLPAEDRKLFDDFASQYPELIRRLFDDDPYERLTALQQIPLEPETGAGVLIVAKVDDLDGEVIEAALDLASRLKDKVVVRGLRRYVTQVLDLLEADFFQAGEQYYVIALGMFVHRAIGVLGEAGATEAVPEILRATRYFGAKLERNLWDVGEVFEALAKLGDGRAAPLMMEYLDDATIRRLRSSGPGQSVSQSVGDAALLGLLEIYGLEPKDYGFVSPPESNGEFLGFIDSAGRAAGHRAFRKWHAEHSGKTTGPTPATKPAGD